VEDSAVAVQIQSSGGNVAVEDQETGAVALRVWSLYFRLLGAGNLALLVPLYLVSQAGDMSSSYVMNLWTSKVP